MEIKVELSELAKNKKLMIAAPMYGGMCVGTFTDSMTALGMHCGKYGIHLQPYFLYNESLITRARNYCADEFLRSDCTHLLFIDSDITFNPKDVFTMLSLQGNNADDDPYDILAAPYPKKNISWEKIKEAVDQGYADDNPNVLKEFVGDFVFNFKEGTRGMKVDQLTEVGETGTGFMMIRRPTLEKFAETYPELAYKPDHARTAKFDGSRDIHMFFQAEVDPKSRRYLSEDYWFCRKAEAVGLRTFLCPWMRLAHTGSYIFEGNMAALAAINASATADMKLLNQMKEHQKQKSAQRQFTDGMKW